MNSQNNISLTEKDQIIRDLKQKLHKAFLQMSDIQKIYKDQIQSQKEQFQQKISQLQEKNKKLQNKLQAFDSPNRLKLSFDLQDFDESFIQPQSIKRTSNSFIHDQTFVQLIKKQGFSSQMDTLKQLEISVKKVLSRIPIPTQLRSYFQFSQKLCSQNTNLRDQLFRHLRIFQNQKKIYQQLNKKIQEMKKNQIKVKKDNQRLAQMYQEQLNKTLQLQKSQKSLSTTISRSNLNTVSPPPLQNNHTQKSANKTTKENNNGVTILNNGNIQATSLPFSSLRVRNGLKK